LGISANQIETERTFSIVGIFITLGRCWLQTDNLDKLIFIHKNWPSNPHVDYLKPSNLTIICEAKFDLTNELDAKFVDVVEHEEYANRDLQLLEVLFTCED
jgi:hypothetical protein